jgi:hypothetical protein
LSMQKTSIRLLRRDLNNYMQILAEKYVFINAPCKWHFPGLENWD